MIFKITIGEKELYFSNKLRASSTYSRTPVEKVNSSDVIYRRKGKYSQHYDLLEKVYTDFNFISDDLDRLDVEFILDELKINIITFHGDIEISNSRGERHLLKGLYSKFRMYYCNIYERYVTTDFSMFRDTFSTFEIAGNDYMHSHCPTYTSHIDDNKVRIAIENERFTGVCLGTSELGTLLNQKYNDISDIDFTTIFMHIDTFIRWESLEGGPHRIMYQTYSKQFGIRVDTEVKNIDVILESLIRSGKLKTNMNGILLNVDNNSISEICEQLDFLKRDKSALNCVYVPDKKKKYEDMEDSFLLSNVFFNGDYVTVNCNKLLPGEYDEYILSIFNNIDNDILSEITKTLNNILKVYTFDKEYEVVN